MKVIFGFIFFMIFYHLSYANVQVFIIPPGRNIIVKANEDVNLTCKIIVPSTLSDIHFPISWILPIKKSSIENRVVIHEGQYERSVVIRKLRESDSGEYVCKVNDDDLIRVHKIYILVKSGKETCLKPWFSCKNGLCIPWNYVCDGYKDCPDGSDESFSQCGNNACKGKYVCDARCIPAELCCDPAVDENCSANYLMPCCNMLYDDILHRGVERDGIEVNTPDKPVQYKHHSFGFYQSTVYTMISCAVAFIFMSTVMLIAVCRLRVRNAAWFFQSSQSATRRQRFWQNSACGERQVNSANNQGATVISLQGNADQSEMLDPLENFVLLTYDATTGFEIAEYGPKPPPYTENNIGVPPPPYSSTLDVSNENPATEESTQLPVDTNRRQ